MLERDWQADWELVCKAQAHNDPRNEFQRVLDVCIYWLHKARELGEEIERLRVQLAGCSAAALGYGDDLQPGDYGWSASYADVVALRKRVEEFEAENRRLEAVAEAARKMSYYYETGESQSLECLQAWKQLRRELAALEEAER